MKKKVEAGMAKTLGVPRADVTAKIRSKKTTVASTSTTLAQEIAKPAVAVSFAVKERLKPQKKNKAGARQQKKKLQSVFKKKLAAISSGKVKLGGIKIPKQIIKKPKSISKVKVIKVLKKVLKSKRQLKKVKGGKELIVRKLRYRALEERSKARDARSRALKHLEKAKKQLADSSALIEPSPEAKCKACALRFELKGGCDTFQKGMTLMRLPSKCGHCAKSVALHCAAVAA